VKQERQLILHQSLTTPELVAGGERELVIVLWTMIFALIFGGGIRPLSLLVGLVIGVLGQYGLIQAAKSDPQWFKVYRRSLTYGSFYPAHSHARARYGPRKPSIPR
jgi:type IV secretory pathway TrbD component